jgi:hypothetical protein
MAVAHVTGDAMFLDVVERVLYNGVVIDVMDSIDDDDDRGEGSSGAPAVLGITLEPRRRARSRPERTRRKTG